MNEAQFEITITDIKQEIVSVAQNIERVQEQTQRECQETRYTIRQYQNQIDELRHAVDAMREHNSGFQSSIIDQITEFQKNFMSNNHNKILNDILTAKSQLTRTEIQVQTLQQALQVQCIQTESLKNDVLMLQEELQDCKLDIMSKYDRELTSFQTEFKQQLLDVSKNCLKVASTKALEVAFHSVLDRRQMELLLKEYSEIKFNQYSFTFQGENTHTRSLNTFVDLSPPVQKPDFALLLPLAIKYQFFNGGGEFSLIVEKGDKAVVVKETSRNPLNTLIQLQNDQQTKSVIDFNKRLNSLNNELSLYQGDTSQKFRDNSDAHDKIEKQFSALQKDTCRQLEQQLVDQKARWIKEKSNLDILSNKIIAANSNLDQRMKELEVSQTEIVVKSDALKISMEMVLTAMQQDERDKQGLSLAGLNPDSTVLRIDSNCLSCLSSSSNQQEKTRVLNAFKLACLQYKPSKVLFQQKYYDRLELLQQSFDTLELKKQKSVDDTPIIIQPLVVQLMSKTSLITSSLSERYQTVETERSTQTQIVPSQELRDQIQSQKEALASIKSFNFGFSKRSVQTNENSQTHLKIQTQPQQLSRPRLTPSPISRIKQPLTPLQEFATTKYAPISTRALLAQNNTKLATVKHRRRVVNQQVEVKL